MAPNLVEEHTIESDGHRLLVRRWAADRPKATAMIVHGYGEHGGRYADVARYLNARGYDVWALDLRGHGRSEGPRAYVESMDEYVRDVRLYVAHATDQGKKRPSFLIGHSLGGCITTLFLLRERPSVAGVVLSGPALKLGEDFSPSKIAAGRFLGKFIPRLPIEKLESASVSRDPAIVRAYQNDPLVYHGWIRTGFGLAFMKATEEIDARMPELELPLLVLQGGKDKLVNKKGGEELYSRARSTDKKHQVYPELYHEVFNEPERDRVLGDLVEWLDAHCESAARPSDDRSVAPR